MNTEQIFQKLKQEYAHLGLGDSFLQAQAESLMALGLVTDENLETVVKAQKTFLEGLQKSNDKRVTDAVAKVKAEFEKEREEAKKKAEQAAKEKAEKEAKEKEELEAKRLAEEKAKQDAKDMPEWYIKEKESNKLFTESLKKQIDELVKANSSLSEGITSLKKENDNFKVAKAKAEKENFIITKAKELGIPQYRIDEGFVIGEDADTDAITSILTKIADNVKVQQLPKDKHFPLDDGKPSDKEISDLANDLMKF